MEIKIFIISDDLTSNSLNYVDDVCQFPKIKLPLFAQSLNLSKVDFLLVESAWQGYKNSWKYKIASYPDNPRRNNNALVRLVNKAKEKGIPTVFWNKEDSVHFDRFIDSAKHFDHIFTVDVNAVERYRAVVPETTTVDVAMFPVQPKFHNFQGFNFKHTAANFVGSYSSHIHDRRRMHQEMLFSAAQKAGFPVTVFDRNSGRTSSNYRYPEDKFNLTVQSAVEYPQTGNIYRDYLVSLNVNTIEDSPTMFSRRVVEILACGGILVSTPSVSMDSLFKDYCHIVHSEEEAQALFERLKYGPNKDDLERALAGANFVLNNFTWDRFIQKIFEVIERKSKACF